MIRFLVDIEWDVIRLVIWHVFTTGQVERDIKEIPNFLVGSDRYFNVKIIIILNFSTKKRLNKGSFDL